MDSPGNAYITGYTASSNFPTAKSFQASSGGAADAFVAKIGSSASNANITIATNPDVCSFTIDGETYTTTQTFSWAPGSSYTLGATTQQETNGTRCTFSSWSDGGAAVHMITTPSIATTYTASFTVSYRLIVSRLPTAGGDVAASPTSLDGYYTSGTPVQLTATAQDGYVFSTWSGDLTGTINPQTVSMSAPRNVIAVFLLEDSSVDLSVSPRGAAVASTSGSNDTTRIGYATLSVNSGATPYGTAVFSFKQSGVTVTEAGVPASPPTTRARIFIEYRDGVNAIPARTDAGMVDVNTGIAVVNYGSATANVTFTLRDMAGATVTAGHGTIAAGNHLACFINELKDKVAPDFNLPPDFQNTTQFASLEMASDQPISVVALRGTSNQRDEFLITTTPTADLTNPLSNSPIYFPQFVDGGGYTTSLILLNTSGVTETGSLQIMDHHGAPFVVNQVGGTADSSFRYSIPPNGAFRFQTDGFPIEVKGGWVRLTPDSGKSTPVGSGVFGFNPGSILVSESGIPSAVSRLMLVFMWICRGTTTQVWPLLTLPIRMLASRLTHSKATVSQGLAPARDRFGWMPTGTPRRLPMSLSRDCLPDSQACWASAPQRPLRL
jgi:hypothetical protein